VTVYFGPAAENQHVGLGHRREELHADVLAAHLSQIVILGKVVQIAGNGVLAVGGHVGDVGAAHHFPHARNGRGMQLIRRRSGISWQAQYADPPAVPVDR